MEHFSYFSDNFSVTNTSSYILSLQAGDSSFAYTIADSIRNEYVAVKAAAYDEKMAGHPVFDKIQHMIKEDAFLNKSYKSINFAYLTPKSILIPTPLFDKNSLKKMFQLTHPLDESEELHFNYLPGIDSYNAFALPSKITTFMVNHFPEIKFFHHSSSFITWAFEDEAKSKFKLPAIRVNVNDDFFDILVIMADKPVLYNTFQYKENTDIIYHTANILKQLEIKPIKCYVFLSGKITGSKKTLLPQMKAIFPSAALIREKTDYFYDFPEAPPHLLYNVLNLHKCE